MHKQACLWADWYQSQSNPSISINWYFSLGASSAAVQTACCHQLLTSQPCSSVYTSARRTFYFKHKQYNRNCHAVYHEMIRCVWILTSTDQYKDGYWDVANQVWSILMINKLILRLLATAELKHYRPIHFHNGCWFYKWKDDFKHLFFVYNMR